MKNKKLISYSGIVDAATGEQISSSQRELKLPRTVSFPKHFTKIHDRSRDKLNPKDLWKFIQLTYYLDYDTNKLVYRHTGRKPIAIKQQNMADILGITIRSVNTLVKNLTDCLAMFRIQSCYFINPTFASRSQYISTEHLFDMIKLDPSITNEINQKQQIVIRKYLRAELLDKNL
ncbi:hypothetical protein N9E12_03870 [Candidatus Marinimicrobia bacterium]|nr:hypothetical protein [Candidatus Neomarinimicrobiota bacterium]